MNTTKKEVDAQTNEILKNLPQKEKALRCFGIARSYIAIREFETARRYLEVYISAKPPNLHEPYKLMGDILLEMNLKEEAYEYYKKTYEITPNNRGLLYRICDLIESGGVTKESFESKQRWLELRKAAAAAAPFTWLPSATPKDNGLLYTSPKFIRGSGPPKSNSNISPAPSRPPLPPPLSKSSSSLPPPPLKTTSPEKPAPEVMMTRVLEKRMGELLGAVQEQGEGVRNLVEESGVMRKSVEEVVGEVKGVREELKGIRELMQNIVEGGVMIGSGNACAGNSALFQELIKTEPNKISTPPTAFPPPYFKTTPPPPVTQPLPPSNPLTINSSPSKGFPFPTMSYSPSKNPPPTNTSSPTVNGVLNTAPSTTPKVNTPSTVKMGTPISVVNNGGMGGVSTPPSVGRGTAGMTLKPTVLNFDAVDTRSEIGGGAKTTPIVNKEVKVATAPPPSFSLPTFSPVINNKSAPISFTPVTTSAPSTSSTFSFSTNIFSTTTTISTPQAPILSNALNSFSLNNLEKSSTTSGTGQVAPPPAASSPFNPGFTFSTGSMTTKGFGDIAKETTGAFTFKPATTQSPGSSFKEVSTSSPIKPIFGGGKGEKGGENSTDKADEGEDDFVPTAEFTPVIPLPPLVETSKGDEGEDTVFEVRAKLFRFVEGEWKERGVGNIKILQEKENKNRVRIVMWREQIHKLACNHRVPKDMSISFHQGNEKHLKWSAVDFAEGEGKTEVFLCRFGKPEQCSEFKATLDRLKGSMTDSGSSPPKNSTKTEAPTPTTSSSSSSSSSLSLAAQFKKPEGSWNCSVCLCTNSKETTKCLSCETPKEGSEVKDTAVEGKKESGGGENMFSFGFGASNKSGSTSSGSGGGGANSSFMSPDKSFENNSLTKTVSTPPNIFSVPSSTNTPSGGNTTSGSSGFGIGGTSSFGSTSGNNNVFGTPVFGSSGLNFTTPTFGGGAASGAKDSPIVSNPLNFNSLQGGDGPFNNTAKAVPSLSTFNFSSTGVGFNDLAKESGGFETTTGATNKPNGGFAFNSPSSSIFSSSVIKPIFGGTTGDKNSSERGQEGEDDFVPTAEFTPVIPLPPLVETSKGDEGEDTVFEVRAKLFRFVEGEWKERGVGNIKILQEKENKNRVRIVMWREQIHKLACNHRVPKDMSISFHQGNEKHLKWSAVDFAEGEGKTEVFLCRFGKPEQCIEFKSTIERLTASMTDCPSPDKAPKSSLAAPPPPSTTTSSNDTNSLSALFKKPEGSWTCTACLNSNRKEVLKCPSCDTIKPGSEAQIAEQEKGLSSALPTFSFGFNAQAPSFGPTAGGDGTSNAPLSFGFSGKEAPSFFTPSVAAPVITIPPTPPKQAQPACDDKTSERCSGCIGCDPEAFDMSKIGTCPLPTYPDQTLTPEEYALHLKSLETSSSSTTNNGGLVVDGATVNIPPKDYYGGEEYGDDEEVDEPMFEGMASLQVRYPDSQNYVDMGEGTVMLTYDIDMYCGRFNFMTDSEDSDIDHVICADTHLIPAGDNILAWTGLVESESESAEGGYIKVEFQAIFDNVEVMNNFLDKWNDSQELASQSNVTEAHLLTEEHDHEHYES